ncbi:MULTISPECIES: ATP-binding cassette domain-containing protein [unclassified Streptomyces]|uniref:ATP-binding cassette domain-containing protein n=1 Tax=unclassified Streptomyces TaxID=2593676 RepID=UPI0030837607
MGRRHGLRGPWALRGVGLELPAHTLVRVEGANGSGKTTLLRLLAGIDAPTEGRITGRPRTAYVPERFPAALPFTAAGYLVHMGRVHGFTAAEAAGRAEEWLARFGAAGHARTPLAELSKGTSQKVAVAQALLAGPQLLVLDEAWTGLDAGAREELDRAVTERVAEGATVVFVDHDPRRLAGSAVAYRLDGLTLAPVGTAPHHPGPRIRIEATGPASAPLPARLPGAPAVDRDAGDPFAARFTTTTAHSDRLLHALLTADPPWHITGVTRLPEPARARASEQATAVDLEEGPAPAPDARQPAPATSPGPAAPSAPAASTAPTVSTGPAAPLAPTVSTAPAAPPVPAATTAPPTSAVTAAPAVTTAPPAASAPRTDRGPRPDNALLPRPAPAPRTALRATAATVRYQAAMLARSQRWLAPLLLYAAALGIGVRAGQPLLDSLGYAAAALVPVAAWFTRLCVTQEPRAARAVTAAAVGPARAHRASVLTALNCALAVGAAGTGIVLLISEPVSTDRTVAVPLPPAALAGLLAAACCALAGTAVGALCARPVLHRRGWSLMATLLAVLLVLVGRGSPARDAVTALVSGSTSGTVALPLLPLLVAAVVAVAVAALTSRIAALRG